MEKLEIVSVMIDYNLNASKRDWENKEHVIFDLKVKFGDSLDDTVVRDVYEDVNKLIREKD